MTRSKATTIKASYRIVTPMFCSGADQSSAELRVPSFKGALRFWWRAGEWGRFIDAANGDNDRALQALSQEEAALFGSCDRGQSRVLLSLKWTPPLDSELVRDWPRNKPPFGSTYLGFGITESGRPGTRNYKPHRWGLPCERDFELTCRIRPTTDSIDVASVVRAMRLLGLVGGLGNRSRRAYGSVALLSLNGEDCSVGSHADYCHRIRDCLPTVATTSALPPFTAFSSHSSIASVNSGPDPIQAHEMLGEKFREFRGQPGPHRGARKRPLGLPLKGVDEERRRASPLLLHVHPIGEEFFGSVLFLPGDFHPEIREGDAISFFEIARSWVAELKGEKL